MKRVVLLVALFVLLPFSAVFAQPSGEFDDAPDDRAFAGAAVEVESPKFVVQVYNVGELIAPRPNYPYRGTIIPTTRPLDKEPQSQFGVMSGLMGGGATGGGLGGGFGGGGMFNVGSASQPQVLRQFGGDVVGDITTTEKSAGLRFDRDELIQAIKAVIEPVSWDDQGGEGVCEPLGGMLLVSQTAENHKAIGELLKAIESHGGEVSTITISAVWLLLDANQLQQIAASKENGGINRKALLELARQTPSYQGQITCFTGQTVHIVSGVRKTVITGAVPVVGDGSTGYSTQTETPNIGVVLQVTPSVVSGGQAAVLDLQSVVTGWTPAAPLRVDRGFFGGAANGDSDAAVIDRLNLPAHQLATAIRAPLGKTVLVGGLTLTKGLSDEESRQLYLFIEVAAPDNR